MAFLLRDLCLFSEVKGVVLQNGKPVANAEVERIHEWKKAVSQIVKTDEQGRFSFPMVVGYSILATILPFDSVTSQTILIRHKDIEYKAWRFGKHDYEINSELDGKPINLVCDLESEPDFREGNFFGIARLAE